MGTSSKMAIYKSVKKKIATRINFPVLIDLLAVIYVCMVSAVALLKSFFFLPFERKKNLLEVKNVLLNICPLPESVDSKSLSELNTYDLAIIIPVFNAEAFIEQCIESVLTQKTKFSYQIICINDGSTDNSNLILSKYTHRDNVRLIVQRNSGISSARNRGLEAAESELVMFLDADDLLLPDAIETLVDMQKSSGADIAVGEFRTFHQSNELENLPDPKSEQFSLDRNEAWFRIKDGFPWGKVYRKKLWQHVRFPVGYQYEDTIIKGLIFRLADKINYTSKNVIGYRQHNNSITVKLSNQPKNCVFIIWLVEFILKLNQELELENDLTLDAFMQEHLTKRIFLRSETLESSSLNAILTYAHFLISDYSEISTTSIAQNFAFKALKNGNFKKWYFWSAMSTYEA